LEDYNTFDQHPWYGTGQGTTDAAIWYIALSDLLIDAYHSKIQPWIIQDPMLTLVIVKSMKAFIDDIAMLVNGATSTLEQMTLRVQTQLQWWTQLIQASGGALNPQKYCCALYHWRPDTSGICRLTTVDPENTNITLCNIRLQQTIHVLKLDEGTQYLDLYMTQSGNTKPMQDHVWHKALLYTKAFQWTHISRHEASILYCSCFLPALTYLFPAMALPVQFLERLHKLLTFTILNKMDTTVISHDSLCLHPMTWEALAFANSFTNKVPNKC